MCLAAPAKVISISGNEAIVDYNGVRTTTRLDTLTEPLAPGDYVLIHTGFAIRRLSAEDGEETLKLFDELSESLRDSEDSSDTSQATTGQGL
jgi:hydrogenase expression/formation protein HypC